jgi:hypothetical protein
MGLIDQPFTGERWFADGQRVRIYRGPGGEKILADQRLQKTMAERHHVHHVAAPVRRMRMTAAIAEIESKARLFRYGCDCYAYALLATGHDRPGGREFPKTLRRRRHHSCGRTGGWHHDHLGRRTAGNGWLHHRGGDGKKLYAEAMEILNS